ncbi:uncharacterized protein MEPE_04597 [Melanopsichium pennsylvanicum]|uniref:Uncharacterized protein n=1 Tax=Melanopsichium pennsylvanicum TaxID=63383 RepID=A0AAJ5C6U9_9BASI|nr:uncharacterized protein MEPE_04597 [Melanopsichium pennsylvanicum]
MGRDALTTACYLQIGDCYIAFKVASCVGYSAGCNATEDHFHVIKRSSCGNLAQIAGCWLISEGCMLLEPFPCAGPQRREARHRCRRTAEKRCGSDGQEQTLTSAHFESEVLDAKVSASPTKVYAVDDSFLLKALTEQRRVKVFTQTPIRGQLRGIRRYC